MLAKLRKWTLCRLGWHSRKGSKVRRVGTVYYSRCRWCQQRLMKGSNGKWVLA